MSCHVAVRSHEIMMTARAGLEILILLINFISITAIIIIIMYLVWGPGCNVIVLVWVHLIICYHYL